MFKNTRLNLSPRHKSIGGEKPTLPGESMGDHVKDKQKGTGKGVKDTEKVKKIEEKQKEVTASLVTWEDLVPDRRCSMCLVGFINPWTFLKNTIKSLISYMAPFPPKVRC